MGFNVAGFDGTRSVVNPDRVRDLVLGGKYVVGTRYKIVSAPEPVAAHDLLQDDVGSRPPGVGEALYVCHECELDEGCIRGYEHLTVFIGRRDGKGIHNYVRYFDNVADIVSFLDRYTLEPDREWATLEVKKMKRKITKLKKEYGL